MFTKVLILSIAVAVASAVEYPHGMHPALCPNFPICDANVLMRHTIDGHPIPDWELPYRYYPYAMPYAMPYARSLPIALRGEKAEILTEAPKIEAIEPAKYPADVDPATCPNYPYCS